MAPGLVQQHLRSVFRQWGLPAEFRVDNGSPWGSWSDLPPPLALWLIGLGLEIHWNPPQRPQANGVVERSQGVAQAWAEPERCASPAELQRRLDEEDRLQREAYPHELGRPRWQVYPELRHSGRPYSAAWEKHHWSWARVCAHVATYVVERRVDSSGKIGLYQTKVYVGSLHRGSRVVVQFDAGTQEWVLSSVTGSELCRRPLEQFDAQKLCRL